MNNIMQMLQTFKNPQAFMQTLMKDSQYMQNPMVRNAMDMYQRGDNSGLEKMARNICNEKGINPDEALQQIKQKFGF